MFVHGRAHYTMIDRNSKTFLIYFFGAILISIVMTYNAIYIRHDYRVFTIDDDIPSPTDAYTDLLHLVVPGKQ